MLKGYVKTYTIDANTSHTPELGAHGPCWPHGCIIIIIIIIIIWFVKAFRKIFEISNLSLKSHDPQITFDRTDTGIWLLKKLHVR